MKRGCPYPAPSTREKLCSVIAAIANGRIVNEACLCSHQPVKADHLLLAFGLLLGVGKEAFGVASAELLALHVRFQLIIMNVRAQTASLLPDFKRCSARNASRDVALGM
jgi:hypothetical protein